MANGANWIPALVTAFFSSNILVFHPLPIEFSIIFCFRLQTPPICLIFFFFLLLTRTSCGKQPSPKQQTQHFSFSLSLACLETLLECRCLAELYVCEHGYLFLETCIQVACSPYWLLCFECCLPIAVKLKRKF